MKRTAIALTFAATMTSCGSRSGLLEGRDAGATIGDAAPEAALCLENGSACTSSSSCCDGVCSAGVCGTLLCPPGAPAVELAKLADEVFDLGVDASFVYWAANDQIVRMKKQGGAPEILATVAGPVYGLTTSDSTVFFTTWFEGELRALPKTGGASTVLAQGLMSPSAVQIDSSHAYWRAHGETTVGSVPLTGGPITILENESFSYGIQGLGIDDAFVYFEKHYPASDTYFVSRVPKTGGPISPIAPSSLRHGIVADAADVYWTGLLPPAIMRAPKVGGPASIFVDGVNGWALLDAGDFVYFSDEADGSVGKASKSGGQRIELGSTPPGARAIALDDSCIYWSTVPGSGAPARLMKAPR